MKHRTAIVKGERVELAWTDTGNTIEASVNGRTYKLEKHMVGAQAYWFGYNGRSVEAVVAEREAGYEVSILGHRISVDFLDSIKIGRGRRAAVHKGVADVRAPMPGRIVRVLLGREDEVEARQGIVVMEAMKMQNEIRSPKRGKISELNVAEGDAVNLGDLIARVE